MSVAISFKPCVGSLTPVDVSPTSLVSTSNDPSIVISLAAAVTVLFILFASIITVTLLAVMVVLKRKGVGRSSDEETAHGEMLHVQENVSYYSITRRLDYANTLGLPQ